MENNNENWISHIIENDFNESISYKKKFLSINKDKLKKAGQFIIDTLKNKGKILIFGNGGSAADSQHFACELVNTFLNKNRPPLPAIALTTDTSVLTSIANDTDFDQIFKKQIEALGNKGDLAIAISTSGKSKNVINAILKAKEKGIFVIGITGKDGGDMAHLVDIELRVPGNITPHIQESHITILHILCHIVDLAWEKGLI